MTEKKAKISQAQIISYLLLTSGLIITIASFLSNSSIEALIGLGLIFWGALLLYIRPEDFARKNLIKAAVSPSLVTLNQLIRELGYKGDKVYLPPKYFTDPETTKLCITKSKDGNLPSVEQTFSYGNPSVVLLPQALLLTPSGFQLSRLLEETLGKKFEDTNTNLASLQRELPIVFIADLGIAKKLEIQIVGNTKIQTTRDTTEEKRNDKATSAMLKNMAIHAKITKPTKGLVFSETGSVECPICSAIAIAITKATEKPVRIVEIETSENDDVIEASYVFVEE